MLGKARAKLGNNMMTRFVTRTKTVSEDDAIVINFDSKYNFRTLGILTLFGIGTFGVGVANTMVRKETFARNQKLIEEKYGQ